MNAYRNKPIDWIEPKIVEKQFAYNNKYSIYEFWELYKSSKEKNLIKLSRSNFNDLLFDDLFIQLIDWRYNEVWFLDTLLYIY